MIVYTSGYKVGFNHIIDMNGNGKSMLQDAGVLLLPPGNSYVFSEVEKEIAMLLQTGDVEFEFEGNRRRAVRESFLDGNIYCLHVSKNTKVTIHANKESEIYVLKVCNERTFPPKLYCPEDVPVWENGKDVLDNTMLRYVYTIFDYQSAPYSNMVLGTVVSAPGRWSAYPPHIHPQPELYYYKFDKPQGFGLGLVGEKAYLLRNDSYMLIDGMQTHPMVTAPGYSMLTVWSIVHLPGNPWDNTRTELQEHKWMMESDAIVWQFKD